VLRRTSLPASSIFEPGALCDAAVVNLFVRAEDMYIQKYDFVFSHLTSQIPYSKSQGDWKQSFCHSPRLQRDHHVYLRGQNVQARFAQVAAAASHARGSGATMNKNSTNHCERSRF
jgi:hypothetical protein